MFNKRGRVILFFIAGMIPTAEEVDAAEQIGTTRFRNASLVKDDDAVEMCDGVAGLVPKQYERFPLHVVNDDKGEIVKRDEAPVVPVTPKRKGDDAPTPAPGVPWAS